MHSAQAFRAISFSLGRRSQGSRQGILSQLSMPLILEGRFSSRLHSSLMTGSEYLPFAYQHKGHPIKGMTVTRVFHCFESCILQCYCFVRERRSFAGASSWKASVNRFPPSEKRSFSVASP